MINVKYYEQRSAYDADKPKLILPNVSYCEDTDEIFYNPKPHDYSNDYLTFVAEEDGTFKFSGNSVNYSVDDGETWIELANNTDSPTVPAGGKIMWNAELTPTSNGIGKFSSSGSFTAQGNAMSLLYGDNFIGQTSLSEKNHAFYDLFNNCTSLTSAENMSLPATTLAETCYENMFNGCTSLTNVPELPATTLAIGCYYRMFEGCTSLTTAPVLPATTLSQYCYQNMFAGCTSLTTASELPATTFERSCYYGMFSGCTSLITAPALPATTVVDDCYNNMFQGCTHLNSITCLATDIFISYCTINWVNGVAATGTFTKAASMTSWKTGTSGIPSGWTVEDYQP